ncbi:protein kinase family protein [Streptomyces sp. NBC_00138]|nr:protein kinase family protein [Streptomyces sp. NBC_00223]
MADRSTAAVGVASEGGEAPLAAQQSGATSDGTTTDDQTSSTPDGAHKDAPREEPTTTTAAAAKEAAEPAPADPAIDESSSEAPVTPDAEGPEPVAVPAEPPVARTAAVKTAKTAESVKSEKAGAAVDTDTTKLGVATKTATKTTTKTGTAKPAGGPAANGKQPKQAKTRTPAPELHSGHKLARRYQLAECVTRVDGFSSWRAVDEKLRRAVGIHILPADHPRARKVLSAARSAALLGDPRFVQVLDAVDENDLVYVIHEWLPDATSLADLLAAGPLEPHEAHQMVSQVSQGMAAAHREGLAHLRLDPGAVLRTVSGQYRIRGLAVAAALRGLTSERPQREDTEAIGALLYAALTQRWPYEEDAHGLAGLPKGVGLIAPDQVRAGVHRGLSEVAMRALVNDGATASREESPCTTPEELAKVVAGLPRIRPPEQVPPVYRAPAFQQPPPPVGGHPRPQPAPPAPPPALPGRTGQILKWAVSALVIVAIGLGSWQLADTLKSREDRSTEPTPTGSKAGVAPPPKVGPVTIVTAKDFDPLGDHSESPSLIPKVYDKDPSTYWQTSWYTRADFGGLKSGVGVILDLGSAHRVSNVNVDFMGADTSVDLMAASSSTTTMPTELDGFTKVTSGSGTQVTLTPGSKVTTRFLLVWLTKLPPSPDGFRGKISEISVTG